MRIQLTKVVASVAVSLATALGMVGGCSDAGRSGTDGDVTTPGGVPNSCTTPGPGCACSTEGALVSCGKVTQRIGDYVTCSNGLTECKNGRFTACEGDQIVTKRVPQSRDLRAQGLGSPATCANPCSPACATVTDTPLGLDAGVDSGLTVTDAGLQLEPISQIPATCTSLQITPTSAPAKDVVITGPGPWDVQFTATLLPAGCYTGVFQPLWGARQIDVGNPTALGQFDVVDMSPTGKLSVITPIAGVIEVRAAAGGLVSNTVFTNIIVNRTTSSTTSPPAAGVTAASFPPVTGTTPADNVTVLYPYEGTMFPLGLPAPLLQWRTPSTATGIKVTLRYPATGPAIFESSELRAEKITYPVPLASAKERAIFSQADWSAFEQTVNRNRASSGDTGALVVRRVVAGVARQETVRQIRFAPTQLKGRVIYNTYGSSLVRNAGGAAQSGGGAFPNGQYGAATLEVKIGNTAPTVIAGTNSLCVVCHTASSDGQMLVSVEAGGWTNRKFTLPGAPAVGANFGDIRFTFAGIHPSKNRVLTTAGAQWGDASSKLYDGSGNPVIGGTRPSGLIAAFPAFSHNTAGPGLVAFTFRAGTAAPLANPATGPVTGDMRTLSMMTFDGSNTFSNFRNMYTPPANRAAWWPAFLPDADNGMVFHVARTDYGETYGGTGAAADIWWVNTTGAAQAVRLDALNGLNAGGGSGYLPSGPNGHDIVGGPSAAYYEQTYNYEPTVLPVSRGGFSWVVFTSRRMYGNVATVNPFWSDPRGNDISIEPTPKKLWMSAMKANPAPGTDPSYPAFYLPGQELTSGNSRGYFVLEACRNPGPRIPANECENDLDCCAGSVCALDRPITNPAKRYCYPAVAGVCRPDGSVCSADAECCNFSTGVRCGNGTCALPPPIYNSAPFDREYTASCGAGKRVEWSLYQWKSDIPTGTSITFQAQTRASAGDPWGPFVNIGSSTTTATAWTSGAQTVAQAFRAAGQPSGYPLVNVRATFNIGSPPNFTPVLKEWRLGFDCVANE
jgi:hypothetical protein